MRGLSAFKSLPAIKQNLSAILLRPHSEVNPIGSAALLLNQLIEHPAVFISSIEQQTGVTNHLFRTQIPDIDGAARQVIRALRSPTLHIHLFTPIATGDQYGNLLPRPITGARPQR